MDIPEILRLPHIVADWDNDENMPFFHIRMNSCYETLCLLFAKNHANVSRMSQEKLIRLIEQAT